MTYREIVKMVHGKTNRKSRKIANNTYAEIEYDDSVSISLHGTTVTPFGRLFDDWFASSPAFHPAPRGLRPAMDIEEDEGAITVRTELAGVKKDDVHITLEDGVLTITGEKHSDRETKEKSYHLVERSFGSFTRSVQLPSGVDFAEAAADFSDGVLTVTLPKSEAAKPKTIEIK